MTTSFSDSSSALVLTLLRFKLGTGPEADADSLGACDWTRFERLVAHHALTCLIANDLEGCNTVVPTDLIGRMGAAYSGNRLRNRLLSEVSREVRDALSNEGIFALTMKGASLLPTAYDDPGVRRLDDIDILVDTSDLERAGTLLRQLGFRSIGAAAGRGPMCDIHNVFARPDLATIPIELHWRLFEPYRPYRFDLDEVRRAARPLEGEGDAAFAMSFEHELAHLCLHLERHSLVYRSVVRREDWPRLLVRPIGAGRLIWLFDIALYISQNAASIDWVRFVADAQRWGIAAHLHSVLELCRRALGVAPPDGVIEKLDAGRPRLVEALAHWLFVREGDSLASDHSTMQPPKWSGRVLRAAHTWTSLFPSRTVRHMDFPDAGLIHAWLSHARRTIPLLLDERAARRNDPQSLGPAPITNDYRNVSATADPSGTDYPALRAEIELGPMGDDWVAYDPTTDRTTVLNPTAATVLAHCDGRHRAHDVAARLADELEGAPNGAAAAILDTIGQLATMGLTSQQSSKSRR